MKKIVLFLSFLVMVDACAMSSLGQLKTSLTGLKDKLTSLSEKLKGLEVKIQPSLIEKPENLDANQIFEQLIAKTDLYSDKDITGILNNIIHNDREFYEILKMEKNGRTLISKLHMDIFELKSTRSVFQEEAGLHKDISKKVADAYVGMLRNIFERVNKITDPEIVSKIMTESNKENPSPFLLEAFSFTQINEKECSDEDVRRYTADAKLFAELIKKIDSNVLVNILITPVDIVRTTDLRAPETIFPTEEHFIGTRRDGIPLLELLEASFGEKLGEMFRAIWQAILEKAKNFSLAQLKSIAAIPIPNKGSLKQYVEELADPEKYHNTEQGKALMNLLKNVNP